MGKRRQQVVYVDNNRTQTAADIETVEHCDALLRRLARDIQELEASGATDEKAPRHLTQAVFYRKLGLRELEKRRKQLLA